MMTIESFLSSVNLIFNKILFPLLNLFSALLILLVVLLAARFLRNLVALSLKAIQLDIALEKLKFNKLLEKADIKKTASELFGELVYWMVIFVVVLGLAAMVGIPIESALDRLMSFTGIILLAAITLSLGSFLAILIAHLVFLIGSNLGFAGSKTISRLIQYATVIFAFLLALEQLGIGPALLVPSIGVIIGAVGLAVAIAFGLGCKDIMADFVSNLIKGK